MRPRPAPPPPPAESAQKMPRSDPTWRSANQSPGPPVRRRLRQTRNILDPPSPPLLDQPTLTTLRQFASDYPDAMAGRRRAFWTTACLNRRDKLLVDQRPHREIYLPVDLSVRAMPHALPSFHPYSLSRLLSFFCCDLNTAPNQF